MVTMVGNGFGEEPGAIAVVMNPGQKAVAVTTAATCSSAILR
jgi:hypothetical protein